MSETRPLVERLRQHADWHVEHGAGISARMLREAADQIEADAERIKQLEANKCFCYPPRVGDDH